MRVEDHSWHSPSLGQNMRLRVYGHYGRALLVFPAGGGTYHEYEDFGMIDACSPFIESGRVKIFTVDSMDKRSWLDRGLRPWARARVHEAYERYILDEVCPFIHSHCFNDHRFLLTGCSMGGFHSVNFLFRFPWAFEGIIALSGVYSPGYFIGDYMDGDLARFFPPLYIPSITDSTSIDLLRSSRIIACVGQGPWERAWDYDCIRDAHALREIFSRMGIPALVDFWGYDVSHDWQWWKVQMPYFLSHLNL